MKKRYIKDNLTVRQKEIAICLIKGMSAKEISKKFGISLHTVNDYQKVIKRKLICKNAYQTGYELGRILKK